MVWKKKTPVLSIERWDFYLAISKCKYVAVPGFMDAHVHIETTLLTLEALASVIVPWGTTTMS